MNIKEEVQNTKEYKRLIEKTPFLSKILLKKNTLDSIERIIYQIEKMGTDYILDKNYPYREVIIAKEIIKNKTL